MNDPFFSTFRFDAKDTSFHFVSIASHLQLFENILSYHILYNLYIIFINYLTGCGKRPREDKHIRKKRQTPRLGEATVRERPQPAKIVYGTVAEYGMYPWQVGVRKIYYYDYFSRKKISSVWCGGTIINKHWILSAAHCFDG